MDLKYVVDVSSFLLVESSADSEEDLDPNVSMDYYNNIIVLADEDDAISCSCESCSLACDDECTCTDDQDYSEEDDEHTYEDNHSYNHHDDAESCTTRMEMKLPDHVWDVMLTETKKPMEFEVNVSEAVPSEEERNRLFWDSFFAL
ncbi:hypothetical protein IFM89_037735 [Coptis chinensis]|uniref:Uncharacterized protein n=1 Tax=Coptis chinensis TaxID=261450 RepID=A0A835MDK3_9MAGN|nr:hypothetical protein IFM89_037735 [Coptis chinensis]